jgi:hypothetical protein
MGVVEECGDFCEINVMIKKFKTLEYKLLHKIFAVSVFAILGFSNVRAQTASDLGPQDAFSLALRNQSIPYTSSLPSMEDVKSFYDNLLRAPAPDYSTLRPSREVSGPVIKFDEVRNLFCVNGFTFDGKDKTAAIQSLRYLEIDPVGCPRGAWTGISSDMFAQYIRSAEGIETNYDDRIYNNCVVNKSRSTDRSVLGNVKAACRAIAANPSLLERFRWGE